MLTADLVVTDSGSSTKPGVAGAKTFAQVWSPLPGTVLRRIAATANTYPQVLKTAHAVSGKGYSGRIRSLVRTDYSDLVTVNYLPNGDIDTTRPSCSVQLTIDRPVYSGGAITDAIVMNQVGQIIDVLCVSGQLAKFLNQEG